MVTNANAIRDRTRIIGRHYITFQDSKYPDFQNPASKTWRKNFRLHGFSHFWGSRGNANSETRSLVARDPRARFRISTDAGTYAVATSKHLRRTQTNHPPPRSIKRIPPLSHESVGPSRIGADTLHWRQLCNSNRDGTGKTRLSGRIDRSHRIVTVVTQQPQSRGQSPQRRKWQSEPRWIFQQNR